MTVKHTHGDRFWCVHVNETRQVGAEVIFTPDKNRIVIKTLSVEIIVENMSLKELNNE